MKTLKKKSDVIRVKDNEVNRHTANGYVLCPKSEWKSLRNGTAKAGVETTPESPKKKQKKQK